MNLSGEIRAFCSLRPLPACENRAGIRYRAGRSMVGVANWTEEVSFAAQRLHFCNLSICAE